MYSTAPQSLKTHWLIEPALIATTLALTVLVASYGSLAPLLLSLYYLPVVVAAFYLGRSRSGALALLSVLVTSLVMRETWDAAFGMPSIATLAFCVWAATLGLTALVTGTLSDAWREAVLELGRSHRTEMATDALTGVVNRRGFEEELAARMEEARQGGTALALLLLDIDNFKDFNDRYGHQAGDDVLAGVADVLQRAIRKVDTVARYGGEEFAVLIADAPLEVAKSLAEQTRIRIQTNRFAHQELKLRLTVSVGLAELRVGDDPDSFVQRADAALYCSKEAGKNCAHFHDGVASTRFGAGGVSLSPAAASRRTQEAQPSISYIDDVTGMPTLKVFLGELRRRAAESRRYGVDLCVAVIAVDEIYTASSDDPRAGKDLISSLARLVASVLREPDLTARCNDQALCVLLPWTSLSQGLVPLERLRRRASEYRDRRHESLSFNVSIGVAEFNERLDGCETGVFERAKEAMSAASASGGNAVFTHNGKVCRHSADTAVVATSY